MEQKYEKLIQVPVYKASGWGGRKAGQLTDEKKGGSVVRTKFRTCFKFR